MQVKYIKIALILLVLGSLVVFLSATDYQVIFDQVKKINGGFYCLLLYSFLAYLLGSLAWRYCFYSPSKISFIKLFYIRTLSEIIGQTNPTSIVAGEAAKVHFLKNIQIPFTEKMDSIIISRGVLIFSQITLTVISVFWVAHLFNKLPEAFLALTLIVAMGLFIFNILKHIRKQNRFKTYLKEWKGLDKLRKQIIDFNGRACLFYEIHKWKLFLAFMISCIHWFFGAAEFYTILYYLEQNPMLMDALAIDMGVIVVKSFGAFIPGQLGIEEFGNKWMLYLTGIKGAGIWISVSILRRAKQLFWIVLCVLIYLSLKCFSGLKKVTNGNIIYHS